MLRSTWQRSQGNLSRFDGARVNVESERKNQNPQKDALYNYFIRDDNQAPQRTKNPLSVKKNVPNTTSLHRKLRNVPQGARRECPRAKKRLFE